MKYAIIILLALGSLLMAVSFGIFLHTHSVWSADNQKWHQDTTWFDSWVPPAREAYTKTIELANQGE